MYMVMTSCGIDKDKSPTLIYEDNTTCVAQMKEGYIKSDRTKHIPPKFFEYTQERIKNQQIELKYVQSSNNAADLFTKALPTKIFRKHVEGESTRHYTLFPFAKVFSHWVFFSKVFNEAVLQS